MEKRQEISPRLGGSLVKNMGAVTPEGLRNLLQALQAYNSFGSPVVLDPMGAGATGVRRADAKVLIAGGYFDLIKGNGGEIKAVFGEVGAQQRGVDSKTSTLGALEKVKLVRDLAAGERNVVIMTGAIDCVSDSRRMFAIRNDREFLGRITGSGCVLGTTMSATLAVNREDKMIPAIAGQFYYEIAAGIAAEREGVKGPSTFTPALIDELHSIHRRTLENDIRWLGKAKVETLEFHSL